MSQTQALAVSNTGSRWRCGARLSQTVVKALSDLTRIHGVLEVELGLEQGVLLNVSLAVLIPDSFTESHFMLSGVNDIVG